MNKILKNHIANSTRDLHVTNSGYVYSDNFNVLVVGEYTISIQANSNAYSTPRQDKPSMKSYSHFEVAIFKEGHVWVLPFLEFGSRGEDGYIQWNDKRADLGWEGGWHKESDVAEPKTSVAGWVSRYKLSRFIEMLEEISNQKWVDDNKELLDMVFIS